MDLLNADLTDDLDAIAQGIDTLRNTEMNYDKDTLGLLLDGLTMRVNLAKDRLQEEEAAVE